MNSETLKNACAKYEERFGRKPEAAGYAPGRIEVLGNHTDYNEGLTLSAAIDRGITVCAGRSPENAAALVAADMQEETKLALPVSPDSARNAPLWAKYVAGVVAKLAERGHASGGFNARICGDIPLGAGLSSSAALEVSTAMALAKVFSFTIPKKEIAFLCQAAENEFTGAQCGLLDQFSSLFGKKNALVLCDFRTLSAETAPLAEDACFLVADTGVRHSLVASEYNARRRSCMEAAEFFATHLNRPIRALRDVSRQDWENLYHKMPPETAKRAIHVIGENERVTQAVAVLKKGDLAGFGRLMFESHRSSRENFENSCPELDAMVEAASRLPCVLGARLSGGGFGGSAVVLVKRRHAAQATKQLAAEYAGLSGKQCAIMTIVPSDGAEAADCSDG